MAYENEPRSDFRKKIYTEGKVTNAPLLPEFDGKPGALMGAVYSTPLKYVSIAQLKSAFFMPKTRDMKPIGKPGDYDFKQQTDQAQFGKHDELAAWISEPRDKDKGYVVYFEGMAGHFGDLGVPKPIPPHNKLMKKRGEEPSLEGTDEHRDYRIKRIKALQEHGYGVIAVHLPGFGASKGRPSEAANNAAVDDLIDWMSDKKQGFNMSNLVIMGASQGAGTAAYMASKLSENGYPPNLLALVAPPLSTADNVADAEIPDVLKSLVVHHQDSVAPDSFKINPLIANVSIDTKVLVMGGGKDWVVPTHHQHMIAEAAQKSQHETRLVIEAAGEHSTINPELIASNIDAFLNNEPAIDRVEVSVADSLRYTMAKGNGGLNR